MSAKSLVMDGNTAAAHIAYRVNEVCAIFPITPSSTMAELADAWAAQGLKNIWGQVPIIQQMQSEGGAAGAVHGALQSGALTTTFTASQGFLLMLPNMYKIAGELTPCVFHVAARAIATQALSIFGDHSDVMSARMVGFAMLAATSVQESHDLALVAQMATLESRVPVMFFFDGFRTSHEENKITLIPDDQIRAAIDDDLVRAHRARALTPEQPVIRGTAHNPDTFFQAREAANPFYARVPDIVQRAMDRVGALTGRSYTLFRYSGHPEADRVVIVIGSAFEVVDETAAWLNAHGEKVGVLNVALYRPWDADRFRAALPPTVKKIAVLDRTKEVGGPGEPLYLDVVTTFAEALAAGKIASMPVIVGGRYGLSSKDFDPAMAKTVFDELKKPAPKRGFTIGINDDVSHTSLTVEQGFDIEPPEVVRALFFGLGADGTVGANKNSTKILAGDPDRYAQGYFVYDSKKSGSFTISHLRFGPRPIRAPYLLKSAKFVGIHKFDFLYKLDTLDAAAPGATVLINSPYPPGEVWDELPREVQKQFIEKKLKLYVIDASSVAVEPWPGLAREHDPADVLLRAVGSDAARHGHRGDQEGDREDLCEEGQGRRQEELRGDRQRAREPARGPDPGEGGRPARAPDPDSRVGARVRAQRHGAHPRAARRHASGQRLAGGRDLSHRNGPLREAEHRGRSPGVGVRSLHPVRPVRHRLSAQRDSGQVLRREPP